MKNYGKVSRIQLLNFKVEKKCYNEDMKDRG